MLDLRYSSEKRTNFTSLPPIFFEDKRPQNLYGGSGYLYPLPTIEGTQRFQYDSWFFQGIPNIPHLQYYGYVVKNHGLPTNLL